MNVLFEERKNSGVVSLAFAVKQGGIHESEDEKGISHFIEHMLYKGTKNRTAKQISEDIEKNGGILNGFTEEEMTVFLIKIPSNKIDIALDVLSDMLLNPLFDEKELNKERQVILEELKMRRDMPHVYVIDKIQSLLYSGSLEFEIIGTEKSLNSLKREDLVRKFNEVYSSQNMLLGIVGDLNTKKFKEICNFCNKNFKKSHFNISEPKIGFKNLEKIEKRKGIDQTNLVFAHHSPLAGDKLAYSASVLNCLLVGGMSSRLWQEIREKRNLAYAVKGSYNAGKRYGYENIFIGTSEENLKIIKDLILEEFKKISEDLKKEEFEQVKEQLIGNSKISREDSQGQMLELLYNEVWGDAYRVYNYEKEIKKVKIEDVKKLASKVKEGNYSFLALVPEKE
jgi:predicted Zn-dependent peptidase